MLVSEMLVPVAPLLERYWVVSFTRIVPGVPGAVLHTQLLTAAQLDPPRKSVSAPFTCPAQPVSLSTSSRRAAKLEAISALCPRVIIFATSPELDASASTAIVI